MCTLIQGGLEVDPAMDSIDEGKKNRRELDGDPPPPACHACPINSQAHEIYGVDNEALVCLVVPLEHAALMKHSHESLHVLRVLFIGLLIAA